MIKAIAKSKNGRKIMIIGLSRENLRRFLDEMGDAYITVSDAEMGVDLDVLIFSGETEVEMARAIGQPETKVFSHVDEETKQ